MLIYIAIYLMVFGILILTRKKIISLKISKNLLFKVIAIIFITNTIAFGYFLSNSFLAEHIWAKQVQREGYDGSTKVEEYFVQIEGSETEKVQVSISPQMYNEKEIQELFEEVQSQLDKIVLGENKSKDHVDKNLNLPSKVENFPFQISWELSRYDVMDFSGKLIQDEIIKRDPENKGISLIVTGVFHYDTWESIYEMELMVFAKEQTETLEESIQKLLAEADENSKEQEYLQLPEEWNGKKLTWRKAEEQTGSYFLVLGIVVSILLVFNEKEKQLKEKKHRKEELLLDYPEIISQLTILMGAGMTVKNTWKKILDDYKGQKERTGRRREAYEEMLYTWQEMQSGIPEAECYERFGKRCEALPYMKMGALLAQNLRKGSKGLADMLTLEAVEATEERKNRAKRLGEEAGTKLLVPMLLMLIVVLAIVVVPAFWATNI